MATSNYDPAAPRDDLARTQEHLARQISAQEEHDREDVSASPTQGSGSEVNVAGAKETLDNAEAQIRGEQCVA